MAFNRSELLESLNHYLLDGQAEDINRQQFIQQECTYVDGTAGKLTAEFFLSIKQESVNHPTQNTPERLTTNDEKR